MLQVIAYKNVRRVSPLWRQADVVDSSQTGD